MQGPILGNGFLGGAGGIPDGAKMTLSAPASAGTGINIGVGAGTVTWYKPSGDSFVGETPNWSNFDETGEYTLVLSSWLESVSLSIANEVKVTSFANFEIFDDNGTVFSVVDIVALGIATVQEMYDAINAGESNLIDFNMAGCDIRGTVPAMSEGPDNLGYLDWTDCNMSDAEDSDIERLTYDVAETTVDSGTLLIDGTNDAVTNGNTQASIGMLELMKSWTVTYNT